MVVTVQPLKAMGMHVMQCLLHNHVGCCSPLCVKYIMVYAICQRAGTWSWDAWHQAFPQVLALPAYTAAELSLHASLNVPCTCTAAEVPMVGLFSMWLPCFDEVRTIHVHANRSVSACTHHVIINDFQRMASSS